MGLFHIYFQYWRLRTSYYILIPFINDAITFGTYPPEIIGA
jgi:hypothetical protein